MKNWLSLWLCAFCFLAVSLTLPNLAQATEKTPAQCSGALLRVPHSPSRKASAALFNDVIKTLWDNEGLEQNLGRTVTTIDSLTLGKSYRWRPTGNDSSFGTKPKMVYPIKVKYTTCTEREKDWHIASTLEDELYACYVDEKQLAWHCALQQIAAVKETLHAKPEQE